VTKELTIMMFSALILAASLAGQAPSALAPKPADKPAAKATKVDAKTAERAALLARRKARTRGKAVAAERAAVAASRTRAELEAQYVKMLPFLQEQERIALENQRQQLARMSDAERTAALNRMVSAMERQAGYVYPGQSPTVGPYTGQAAATMNPLYSRLIPE
jgi:hypothetical protein